MTEQTPIELPAPLPEPEPVGPAHRALEDRVDAMQPARASRILFWTIAFTFVFATVWAAFSEIDRTVRGMGRVVSSSQLQVISTIDPGVLEDILVRTGDLVKQGQVLLKLDPTESGSTLGSNAATADALQMKIARLSAEVQGIAPRYPAPANADAARQLQVEQSLYAARQANVSSMLAASRAQVARSSQQIGEAQAVVASADSARAAARSELDMVRPLVEQGLEPRLSLVRAQNAATTAESDYARAQAALGAAQAALSEAQANAARVMQDWRSQAAAELAAAQSEGDARRSSLPALRERVERTTVRAPIEGRVNRVLVSTRGSAINAGQPLVEIVPGRDTLMVEARISPKDIGSVRMGQDAKVGITAYDPAIYGSLVGNVVTISPDSIMDQQTGEVYYTVTVRTSSNVLNAPNGQKLTIGSGMLADVSLLGDKRTVLEYLFSPIARLKERAFRE